MIGSPVAFSIVTSTPGSPRTATPNVDPIQNGETMKNKRTPNTEIVPTWRTRTGQWWLYRIPPNDGRHSRQVLHANQRDQMAYGKANSTPPCGRTRSSSRKRYAMDQISSVSPRIVPRVERQVGTARELASATAPPAIPAPAVANGIAIIGSIPIALAIGMEPMIAIPLATAGAGMAGGAVALASSRAVPTWRSTLGTILGLTLLIWSIAYLLRDDDRVLPQGGVLFAFPYAIWSLWLAWRTWREWRPSLGGIRYSHHWPVRVLQVGTISVFGVLLFFIVFPFWIGSTFGVAVLGDPGVEVTIENATGEPIMFYEVGRRSSFKIQMETAERREWSWLLTGVYTPEATDLSANPLFCRRYSDRDLRQLRYVIRSSAIRARAPSHSRRRAL